MISHHRPPWRWIPLATAAVLLALAMASCSTLGQVPDIPDMTPTELENYIGRTNAQAGAIATVTKNQGDVSPEFLAELADGIDAFVAGTTPGSFYAHLSLDSYQGLALVLFLSELDGFLASHGGYLPDGTLSDNGKAVLTSLAQTLRQVATQ